ncbi:MAG: hypothetical protein IPI65_22145 [Bacteroidetes bacterium]|nr:hypothetical protein [Bacteroidota bacterium]
MNPLLFIYLMSAGLKPVDSCNVVYYQLNADVGDSIIQFIEFNRVNYGFKAENAYVILGVTGVEKLPFITVSYCIECKNRLMIASTNRYFKLRNDFAIPIIFDSELSFSPQVNTSPGILYSSPTIFIKLNESGSIVNIYQDQ